MHMVVFRAADGRPSYHQAEDLDGAIGFVEQLRNTEQVVDVRIFAMQEVPIEFKTYYRVEIAERPAEDAEVAIEVESADPDPVPVAEVSEERVEQDAPITLDEPIPIPVGASEQTYPEQTSEITLPTPVANGRFGLFGRT